MSKDIGLRTTFNSQAEIYHAVRPQYPAELFSTLIQKTNLNLNAKLLEIGPGTGQATKPLAEKGYNITAIELGSDLAEVARHRLASYPHVEILTGAFEEIELPNGYFDLVYAATSFHWIKPEIKFTKSHRILRPQGYLAIIGTNHVSDEQGDEFFWATQPIYQKYKPGDKFDTNFRLPAMDKLIAEEIDQSLFTAVYFDIFPQTLTYSAVEYINLLSTFSPIISLPQDRRQGFLSEIKSLINKQFNGNIEKHLAMSLTIAQRCD